jgi:glycosyltransferase involved in cell wall biosynthesis
MTISLVTPCFNAARFVRETLVSVLSQDIADLEYLVADGGSIDGTAEIIRECSARLAWWVSEPDEGQTSALNKGLSHSTGEILGFLNGDDLLLPGALQTVGEAFAANPDVDLVYGGVEWIDTEGNVTGRHLGEISSLEEILDIYRVWWRKRQWVQPEVFFRRRLWERVGAFDAEYHLAFDFDYWVRCFLAGARVLRIPECLVQFRLHENQKSAASRHAADEIRHIVKRALSTQPPIPSSTARRISAQLSYDLYQCAEGGERPSFFRSLLRHPEWLIHTPEVRRRIRAACFGRLGGTSKDTALDP